MVVAAFLEKDLFFNGLLAPAPRTPAAFGNGVNTPFSQRLTGLIVLLMRTIRDIQVFALLCGLLLLTSCSTPSPEAARASFMEADSADFIAKYYTDETSYCLKPSKMDGAYRSICDRTALLGLARQQPRHELAVVVLVHYPGAGQEDITKLAWVNDLKGLGYQRIVFLRGHNSVQVNGLPVLEIPLASPTIAGK